MRPIDFSEIRDPPQALRIHEAPHGNIYCLLMVFAETGDYALCFFMAEITIFLHLSN